MSVKPHPDHLPLDWGDKIRIINNSKIGHPLDPLCIAFIGDNESLTLVDPGIGLNYCSIESIEHLENSLNLINSSLANLETVISTHIHLDHIGAVEKIIRRKKDIGDDRNFTLLVPELESDALAKGEENLMAINFYRKIFPTYPWKGFLKIADKKYSNGDKINVDIEGCKVTALHLPGHTVGMMGLFVEFLGSSLIICSDAMGVYYKEFGSNIQSFANTMQAMISIDPDFIILGHTPLYAIPGKRLKDEEGNFYSNLERGYNLIYTSPGAVLNFFAPLNEPIIIDKFIL